MQHQKMPLPGHIFILSEEEATQLINETFYMLDNINKGALEKRSFPALGRMADLLGRRNIS